MEIISSAQCFRDPLEVNDIPLSLCNDLDRPKLGMISWSNFILPPPQLSQPGWESLQSILWMYLSWLIGTYTLEKLASGEIRLPVLSWVGPKWLDRLGQLLGSCLIGKWDKRRPFIVVWRPVPLKDLSSNPWKAFSPKWVVACKELTNFHWRFPGRKRSPSFWNHPIWSSWKPLLLALTISPSVCEGISGKLVCGTKVATSIRSLFCNAALLAAWLAAWFPHATSMLPFRCSLQWETETSAGRWTASKRLRIWSPYLIGNPRVVEWPLCFQIAACAGSTRKGILGVSVNGYSFSFSHL